MLKALMRYVTTATSREFIQAPAKKPPPGARQ